MANRFQIIPAVYLVLVKDNKILLSRRFNTGYMNGFYSMIAGHLDGDEPLRVALAREAEEEAGITIDVSQMKLIHTMHTKSEIDNSTDDERVDFYFEASSYDGVPSIQEPDKCDDMSWFSLDDLPKNIVPRVKQALKHINNGEVFSEFGWK